MHPRLRQLETELRAGQPGAQERFWRVVEASGAPLVRRTAVDTCQVTFVWRHDGAARSVAVIQDWGADGLREHFMARLPGSDVWHLERPYPSDAITTYQFSPSADPDPQAAGPYQLDPLNPHRSIAFLSETGNDFVFSALRLPDAPEPVPPVEEALRGRIALHHPTPGRRVWSYTPALPSPEPHPVLVVFDGRQYKDLLHLPRILDTLIAAADIPPVMALFGDPPSGMSICRATPSSPPGWPMGCCPGRGRRCPCRTGPPTRSRLDAAMADWRPRTWPCAIRSGWAG